MTVAAKPIGVTWTCHTKTDDIATDEHTEWVVGRTRPRAEKALFNWCKHRSIASILPLERRSRHYPGKGWQHSNVPLLTGYVIAEAAQREALYDSGHILHLIDPPDQATFRDEIASLAKLLTIPGDKVQIRPELVPGTPVTVTVGSLGGFSGIVTKRKGLTEVTVNLAMLGTAVSTQVHANTLEINTEHDDS